MFRKPFFFLNFNHANKKILKLIYSFIWGPSSKALHATIVSLSFLLLYHYGPGKETVRPPLWSFLSFLIIYFYLFSC